MPRSLVIVESPAKASTLAKFLGKDFEVAACYGHVRDLQKKGIAVDRGNDYAPNYQVVPGKERTVAELIRLARKVQRVFLAADPDREGEAICWHLLELLRPEAPKAHFHRAEFHEITKSAVTRAIEHPGEIDIDRVNAQQARRIIDRLVGYEVSDLLWSKVWRGLSAGRVQTVTLRIIVERESERERFVPVPYFSVPVVLSKGPATFPARVTLWRGEKLKFDGTDPRLATAEAAHEVLAHIQGSDLVVASVDAREQRRHPVPPFTTSKLQQAAARALGFAVRRTMQVAQRLYEGKAVGDRGSVGLITYMRSDSTRVADEALAAVRAHIASTFGPDTMPAEPRRFKQKKDAQDAHEAIRPTDVSLPPEAVGSYLQADELKLYRLIWNRFVASQMNPSVSDITAVDIEARSAGTPELAVLRATGSVLREPGWLAVYGQVADAEAAQEEETSTDNADEAKVRLPLLAAGDATLVREASVGVHETQPPPRFNEASLVKYLEENGIGRPSTYADILRKIEAREYVRKKDRRFFPTPLGRLVVDLIREGFDDFFQTAYTARMEEELDEVEEGKLDWREALREFDGKFSKDRERAKKRMVSVKLGLPLTRVRELFEDFKLTNDPGDTCPESGHALKLRMGKAGLFVACGGYPECSYTVDIPDSEEDAVDVSEIEEQTCDDCGSPMKLRTGRNGTAFLGCTAYPTCRFTVPVRVAGGKAEAKPDTPTGEACPVCGKDLVNRHGRFGEYVACAGYPDCRYRPPKPETDTGVLCPECGLGRILERKGRFGPFYGCSRYPSCQKNIRVRPVPKACPECGAAYLLVRERKAGAFYTCDNEGCAFDEPALDLDQFPLESRISEEAREAAIAVAKAAPPPKKGRARKASGPRKKPGEEAPSADRARGKGKVSPGERRVASGEAKPSKPKSASGKVGRSRGKAATGRAKLTSGKGKPKKAR